MGWRETQSAFHALPKPPGWKTNEFLARIKNGVGTG
jgi:hypothetical protein